MKKGLMIAGGVALILGAAGVATIQGLAGDAASAADTVYGAQAMASEFSPAGVAQSASAKLHLSQEQRAQIKKILKAEKPQAGPAVHELASAWKEVQALTSSGNADASEIRAAIDKEQPAVATLIVEAARTKTTIYNEVLTPSQREAAKGIFADVDGRLTKRLDNIPSVADRLVKMASWKLNLTDSQQEQIRSLVDAGVKHDLPLIKELANERLAIQSATADGAFDEGQVRKLAEAPAKTATELAGDAAVLKTQVFAVLTPAQRKQVAAFQAQMKNHRAARFHRFFPNFPGTEHGRDI